MEIKSELDLSGKLIIKVQLGDDIRRIPIHNESLTYDELVLMMQRVFRGKLSANDDITIKYKDEDGDLITIFESNDLSFAIQCSRILKLQILLNSDMKNDSSSALSSNEVTNLKKQLRNIRDQVNTLLDTIDVQETKAVNSGHPESGDASNLDLNQSSSSMNKVNSSEFDPLQDKTQKNGTEDVKDNSKPSTPQINNEGAGSRPQSVSMTTTPGQQSVVTSAANPHAMTDYFGRSSSAGNFPGMQYSSLPYPQQYNFQSTGRYVPQVMDSSQVPSSNAYSNPSQASLAYPQQQQYGHPPVVYPASAQGNPYSKGFTQPSPQHGFMPPRQ
ncbi:unnamed protein product [Psylliodes chrysocephalus]|uniref:PB1 domain-containing protein n=1 Tax=Psylliodes chrysocephalus TaxID=3402493 RepID=A0A9P0GDM9_9CUCU|nr:unnamed protein product [Psylliodes chrysocephala]